MVLGVQRLCDPRLRGLWPSIDRVHEVVEGDPIKFIVRGMLGMETT